MKQTTYMCPLCRDENNPVVKMSMSWHKCPICDRSYRNSELGGWEIDRTDFVQYWRERRNSSISPTISYPVVGEIEQQNDVDSQMDNMVKESLDNLLHEIIMVRIFNKSHKKAEEAVLKDEEQAEKSEIDKIFDIILRRS